MLAFASMLGYAGHSSLDRAFRGEVVPSRRFLERLRKGIARAGWADTDTLRRLCYGVTDPEIPEDTWRGWLEECRPGPGREGPEKQSSPQSEDREAPETPAVNRNSILLGIGATMRGAEYYNEALAHVEGHMAALPPYNPLLELRLRLSGLNGAAARALNRPPDYSGVPRIFMAALAKTEGRTGRPVSGDVLRDCARLSAREVLQVLDGLEQDYPQRASGNWACSCSPGSRNSRFCPQCGSRPPRRGQPVASSPGWEWIVRGLVG